MPITGTMTVSRPPHPHERANGAVALTSLFGPHGGFVGSVLIDRTTTESIIAQLQGLLNMPADTIIGTPEVYVVSSVDDDPAVFARKEDAEAYFATFDEDAMAKPAALIVCDEALGAKMIAERETDQEPTDDEIYNRHGVEGGIGYPTEPSMEDLLRKKGDL